jgi:hypothetical protein
MVIGCDLEFGPLAGGWNLFGAWCLEFCSVRQLDDGTLEPLIRANPPNPRHPRAMKSKIENRQSTIPCNLKICYNFAVISGRSSMLFRYYRPTKLEKLP